MVKCPNCKSNINELDEVCPKCGYKFEDIEETEGIREHEDIINNGNKKSTISLIIKCIAVVSLLSGTICFFNLSYNFIYLIMGTISFAVLYGFGEIIQKLKNIENKL